MRTVGKILVIIYVSLITLSSCDDFRPPPKGELCGVAENADALVECNNPLRADGEQDYQRYIKKGDILTNPKRYGDMLNYCQELRTDLKKCERKLAKCKRR